METSKIANSRISPYKAKHRDRVIRALLKEGYGYNDEVSSYFISYASLKHYPSVFKTPDAPHKRYAELRTMAAVGFDREQLYYLVELPPRHVSGRQKVKHYKISATPDPAAASIKKSVPADVVIGLLKSIEQRDEAAVVEALNRLAAITGQGHLIDLNPKALQGVL